jgi:hypothetical protein
MLNSPRLPRSTAHIPIPPIPTEKERTHEFTSLSKEVQLKSLHFEGLGLDFDGFKWESRSKRG